LSTVTVVVWKQILTIFIAIVVVSVVVIFVVSFVTIVVGISAFVYIGGEFAVVAAAVFIVVCGVVVVVVFIVVCGGVVTARWSHARCHCFC
jgi:hypothetical protein